jgi:hypothetical protein
MNNDISFKQVLEWFDRYYNDVVESKKKIRGKVFSGCRIEIHGIHHIGILHEVGVLGKNQDEREVNFVKNVLFEDRELILEYTTEDFKKIVNGEKTIQDGDYFWSDEE